MNRAQLQGIAITLATSAALLAGCHKLVGDATEVKSYAYYSEHADEAAQVSQKCQAFVNSELSTKSFSQRMEWRDTPDGINCGNADRAYAYALLVANQERYRKASEKYLQPLPPLPKQ